MPEEPTSPEHLAHTLIHEELRRWVTGEADQAADHAVDGTAKPLVPPLWMTGNTTLGLREATTDAAGAVSSAPGDRQTWRIWFSDKDDHSAGAMASMFRSMRWFQHAVMVTLSGNCHGIVYRFTVHRQDALAMRNLLVGVLMHAHVENDPAGGLDAVLATSANLPMVFRTLLPPLPYWGSFGVSGPEPVSPLAAVHAMPETGLVVYQLVLRAMGPEACTILRSMMKAEEVVGQATHMSHRGWFLSGEGLHKAEEKVAGPLFGATVRAAVFARNRETAEGILGSVLLPMAGLNYSGGAVVLQSEQDLMRTGITAQQLVTSFIDGTTYHVGMVLSPAELSMLLRFPTEADLGNRSYALDRVPLVASRQGESARGIKIGEETVFGVTRNVIWPDQKRALHMLVTGGSGFGKTMAVVNLAAEIVNAPAAERKEGLALIDPHDKAIVELCCRASDERLDDIILFEGDAGDHVPCLPLFDCQDSAEIDTAVSNISHQSFSLFSRSDMGFNIERGMRNGIRTILLCPELSLLDTRHLFSRTRKGERCRDEVCSQIEDDLLVDYWQNEFKSLDSASLGRIRSRFEYILESTRLRRLLANKIRKITYKEIVDGKKVVLFRTNAAGMGMDGANILGTLNLTGLTTAARGRQGSEGERAIFPIIADEFGNYSNPRTIAHSLRTLRRSDVSLVLVTQNIYALPEDVQEAIGNIDTHLVFQQGWDDAQAYFKAFCGLVPAADFMLKNPGEGYAKVGRELVALTCPLTPRRRGPEVLEDIRANTRRRYCVTQKEFRERMIEEHHVSLDEMKELDLL